MSSLFEQLGRVHFDDLEGYRSRESGLLEYSNSKIMVIMAGREINKRLKVITSMSLTHDQAQRDSRFVTRAAAASGRSGLSNSHTGVASGLWCRVLHLPAWSSGHPSERSQVGSSKIDRQSSRSCYQGLWPEPCSRIAVPATPCYRPISHRSDIQKRPGGFRSSSWHLVLQLSPLPWLNDSAVSARLSPVWRRHFCSAE